MSVNCDFCNTKISSKYILAKHKQTESCQRIKRELEYSKNIIELNNKNNELEKIINYQNKELDKKDTIILTLENKIKSLEDKSEEYRKIVEKAATKSTKTVNNNNNKNTYNHNNYLNYISQEPLKFSELRQNISKLVTTKTIMFDNDDFNEHITKNILRDENGKDKVLCTDINRKNFTYKDEKSGQLVSDPELEKLREQLVKSSNNQSIKKDLLNKLIKKYDGTGDDPYNKFYEYLQNIQFGIPFIEHVAKKTYIKTKPNSNINDSNSLNSLKDEEKVYFRNELSLVTPETELSKILSEKMSIDDINNINIESIDDFEYIDKLYNKMKEFDNE